MKNLRRERERLAVALAPVFPLATVDPGFLVAGGGASPPSLRKLLVRLLAKEPGKRLDKSPEKYERLWLLRAEPRRMFVRTKVLI